MKLKGSAIYYSIFLILLSSTIIGLVLLNNFYRSKLIYSTNLGSQARQNVLSAIELVKGGENLFREKRSLTISVNEDSAGNVKVSEQKWGAYSVVKATSKIKNSVFTKTALIGSCLLYEEPIALYIPDYGRTISVSGNALIKGNVYLPSKTIRTASIEGQPFALKNPVEGEIKKSLPTLPPLNPDITSFAETYLKGEFGDRDSIVNYFPVKSDSIENTFDQKTLVLKKIGPLTLSNCTYSGNIIIWCNQVVTIKGSANLKNIIVFAPVIRVNDHFCGSFQGYALQTIIIDKDCILEYPSTLNVVQADGGYNPGDSLKIIIGKNDSIFGGIFIKSTGLPAYIKINRSSEVMGQVYIPGSIELNGEVIGTLYCKSFFLHTSRARYENHLLNCKIDRRNLPQFFSGVDLIGKNPYKSVIQWF